ncbi:MAG: sodium/solute symporter, partial [Candidatus Omnitrophica bacterium]|nr:sodium/solute symporter [Candidatus Omnitrophota bacterium]
IGNFEWMAAFCLVLLGLVFAPFYFRNQVATLPDYLEMRYSAGSRTVLAFMAVVGALFIHIGMSLYAGSAILERFFGLNVYTSIIIISAVTALYTVLGGLKAVVVTESIQTVLLLIGALAVTLFGASALSDRGISSLAQLRDALPEDHMSMLQPEGGLSWYAVLLGYPVLGIWYWCADQTIVQRVLGAKTERDAQVGPVFAGFIKILPVFLMVFPGVMAYVLFQDKIGEDPNAALPVMIDQLIPVGLKGLISAGLLAALMSTIAGALNSTSTLVSIDIVKKWRPETSDESLVRIGRITACVVMVLAMLWSTQGGRFESIFTGINQMIACLAPPITVVFLWGVFWPRGTQQASLVTLLLGFLVGAVVFSLDFPVFGETKWVTDVWEIPFMMQAWWLFCLCSLLFVIVSLITPRPSANQIEGLCWKHPLAAIVSESLTGIADPRAMALVLVAIMCALYWTFA